MRPVIEKQKFEIRHLVYLLIIVICVIAIGIAVYMQFFKDANLGAILGIIKEDTDSEYKELQQNFLNIFDNRINTLEEYTGNIDKIKKGEEIILLAYQTQEQKEHYTLDLKIPYFNINSDIARQMNQEIKTTFLDKSQSIISSANNMNIIYHVKYKAYLKNHILSLVILSELKEGDNSERIILQTYNYDLKNNQEITIENLLEEKNIDIQQANKKIKEEINQSQEQNIKLAELGYNIKVRDVNSEIYQIQNVEEFFIGENGYLYIIYPYGNKEFTSEIDVVILK